MPIPPDEQELSIKLQERFKQLPKAVQDAITSADVEKRMRTLSDIYKLHLDQWEILENEVMLTLLGFSPIEELTENIKTEIGVSEETARALATDISKIVFEPIRQELERELEHPEAKAERVSDVESARAAVLEKAREGNSETVNTLVASSALPPILAIPATPPPPPPTTKVERAPGGPASGAYKPGETSATRKIVEDDPYREPPA